MMHAPSRGSKRGGVAVLGLGAASPANFLQPWHDRDLFRSLGIVKCQAPHQQQPMHSSSGMVPKLAVETLRVVQLYACLDRIDRLEWADNSLYVLCGLYARSIIQARVPRSGACRTPLVWAVDQPDWTCKIDEGPAGIARTLWAPDGLSLVCIASFQIRHDYHLVTRRQEVYVLAWV
eukprot:scaffold47291_cov20-Tisochrysis_lutea.AAC.1